MRMIVIKQATDLQGLSARLLGQGAGSSTALDALKNLNPHVDFRKIEPGTMLLVPDLPGLHEGEASSVSGDAFEALRVQVLASLDAASARVRSGHEALAAQRSEVAAALRTPGFKRALDTDQQLKAQLDAASEVFKADQAQAKASEETLKALAQQAGAELAALAKVLG